MISTMKTSTKPERQSELLSGSSSRATKANPHRIGFLCHGIVAAAVAWLASAALCLAEPSFKWAVRGGGSAGSDMTAAVATDSSGNVLVIGLFSGTADFGAFSLTSRGNHDAFAGKLSKNGEWLWVQAFGGSGYDDAVGLANDSDGNL